MSDRIKQSFIRFKIFEEYRINAAFSTKLGGISVSPYESMNLSFTTGDNRENVLENYRIFARDIGVDFDKMVLSKQTHKDNILIVNEEHYSMGISKESTYDDIDGMYTEVKELPILTSHADCTPIFFYDKNRETVGLVHAGWRGTAKKISKKMVDLFISRGSKVEDIICAIGPAICLHCYEVGQGVLDAIPYAPTWINPKTHRTHIDLKEANHQILINSGILEKNIEVSAFCTKCDNDLFFSHRLYGTKRGSHSACISLL